MAIYRSDQALVTFGAEAAHGGYQELINATTRTDTTTLNGAHAAGSRSLLVASATNFAVGDFIVIGYTTGGASTQEGETPSEIRRVVGKDGNRIYLNAPTGFHHITGNDVDEVDTSASPVIHATYPTAPSTVADWPIYGNAIKFIPGIYETVDVPDMETSFNPTYALGSSAKRNATFIYKGEQAFNGGIPAFTVLNGWPLRFPIGKLVTLPSPPTAEDASTGTATYSDSTAVTWRKGDMTINLPAQGSNVPYDALVINDATAANNRNLIMITHTDKNEVVQVIEIADAVNKVVRLANPLRFNHISTADDTFTAHVLSDLSTRTYTHTITEESDLDSISMHVHMRDSGETAANDFDRRYYGGRIGTSVIAGEEAGMLTMSWDGMQFMGMVHNQQKDVNFEGTGPSKYLPRFNFMQSITDTEGWVPPKDVTEALPLGTANDPFLFSQGQITMFGNVIATIRSFALTINNSPEARYYTGSHGGNRERGPYEIINQRRDYSLAITAVEPVSKAATATAGFDYDYDREGTATHDPDTVSVDYHDGGGNSIFKEMLMEGDYAGVSGTSPRGLSFEIILSKDGLADSGTNYIKIEPGYATGTSAPAFGLNKQGVFIQSAKYNLDGSSPIQAELDILLRSVKITVVDNNPIYP